MAGMRKLRGKYYARLCFNGKEKLIPLKTLHQREAERRLKRIREREWLVIARIEKELELGEQPTIAEAIKTFFTGS